MIIINKFIVTGNLVRESELKFVPSTGMAICKFSIANNEGYGDKKTVNFFNCTAFGKTAEAIANYTHKGSKVLIDGKVQLGSYEKKDGSGKVNTVDIIVNQIEFLDKKADGQTQQPQEELPGEEMFEPVEDDDSIPF